MAYNRTFNADALPAFPEPERKQASNSNNSPANYPPPRGSSSSAPTNPSYSNKPPPPLPQQQQQHQQYQQQQQPRHDYRSNSYGGSTGQGRPPAQDLAPRHNSYGTQGGRQPSPQPILQPQGNYGYSSSPPINQGRFPSPNHQGQMRPQQQGGRLPPSPGLPAGSDPSLMQLFRAVDKTGTGQLTEPQLSSALVNGDWTPFDPVTVRLMIRMFDTDGSGTIGFDEFCGLWSFLASWRTLFDRFDTDRSGNISLDEFSNALLAFGYRLTPDFVRYLFGVHDKGAKGVLSFDLFVQACISLKRMTDVFKRYDDDRDGFIQLSFEEFLMEILRQR